MILKMLHALPFLLQLLQKDNITGNEIANSHMGCLLCAFLVVWGGGLFGWFGFGFFLEKEHDPSYSLLLYLTSAV